MFGSESCLHGLYKLAHDTRRIAEQIAYWYTIHRSVHSMSVQHQTNTIVGDYLMDGYLNEAIIQKYKQQCENLFHLKYSCSANILYRSRYKAGLIVYHSVSYSFRKQSSSFNIRINNNNRPKKKCFGKILFFFSFKAESFSFLLFHPCSQSQLFSSAIPVDEHLPFWSVYVDKFYYVADAKVNLFCILPCTALLSKCFFSSFCDNRFMVCTPIDNELEHD